jgi:hypothetical protein
VPVPRQPAADPRPRQALRSAPAEAGNAFCSPLPHSRLPAVPPGQSAFPLVIPGSHVTIHPGPWKLFRRLAPDEGHRASSERDRGSFPRRAAVYRQDP